MDYENKIYFSLIDFTENFDNNFLKFKEIFKDATITDFVKKNISLYTACLENTSYFPIIPEIPILIANYNGENIIDEVQNWIKDDKKEVDQIKRKDLTFSFNAIIDFLNEKNDDVFNQVKDNDFKQKEFKGTLIDGKRLNIVERYKIADKIFNFDKIIRKLNILDTEKHILLSLILGCNQQTARELYNNTQIKRTAIREDLLNNYFDSLNI